MKVRLAMKREDDRLGEIELEVEIDCTEAKREEVLAEARAEIENLLERAEGSLRETGTAVGFRGRKAARE